MDIIQQIESFYNSAWEKLIITASLIFAIFGIGIPSRPRLTGSPSVRDEDD